MNFRLIITLGLLVYIVLGSVVLAQPVHFPDPNLRAVVAGDLGVDPDRITVVALRRLERFAAVDREIESLEGLQHATNLRLLDLARNRISDLTPLANLHSLEELGLDGNVIKDVSPLAGLTNLLVLTIGYNQITDVEALWGLTNLRTLKIEGNLIVDHSPLDGLSIAHFTYDQVCDMPPFDLESRLKNRTFPSVFAAWESTINQPHLSVVENYAQHDLYFTPNFEHHFFDTGETWELRGVPGRGEQIRDEYMALNPNMVFLVEIRNKNAFLDYPGNVPEDSPYWLKDANGNLVPDFPGAPFYEVDITHPVTQEIIINQALAVARCGLYDGIMFDHWGDSENPDARGRALNNIIERIRAETRPDFLIMGNTNDNKIPRVAEHTNGGFMENRGATG